MNTYNNYNYNNENNYASNYYGNCNAPANGKILSLILRIIGALCASVMLLTLVLPFVSMDSKNKKQYKSYRMENEYIYYDDDTKIKYKDLFDISMAEGIEIIDDLYDYYHEHGYNYGAETYKKECGATPGGMITVVVIFSLLCLGAIIFSVFKKPLIALILGFATLFPFLHYCVVFSTKWFDEWTHFNVGFYLFIVFLVLFVGVSVWALIAKHLKKSSYVGYTDNNYYGMDNGYNQGYSANQNQGYNPTQNQSYNPMQNQGYNPTQNQSYNPMQNQGYNPTQNQSYNPMQNQGYNPTQNQDANMNGNNTYNNGL